MLQNRPARLDMRWRTTNYNQHGGHVRTWGRPYPYQFTTTHIAKIIL